MYTNILFEQIFNRLGKQRLLKWQCKLFLSFALCGFYTSALNPRISWKKGGGEGGGVTPSAPYALFYNRARNCQSRICAYILGDFCIHSCNLEEALSFKIWSPETRGSNVLGSFNLHLYSETVPAQQPTFNSPEVLPCSNFNL
jgi:hypothetical protein